jgi:hypothetical protein
MVSWFALWSRTVDWTCQGAGFPARGRYGSEIGFGPIGGTLADRTLGPAGPAPATTVDRATRTMPSLAPA